MRNLKSLSVRAFVVVFLAAFHPSSLLQAASNIWSQAASLTQARAGSAAVLLSDGQVLFTGGAGANGALATTELFKLDGSFSSAAPMQNPRAHHTAVRLQDGRILVAGGAIEDGSATNSAEIYDPL